MAIARRVRLVLATWLVLACSALSVTGCAFIDNFDDFQVETDAGESGTGGAAGSGGTSGSGGSGGTGGTAGSAGSGGTGGTSGAGGTSGSGGTAGSGGTSGSGGVAGGTDAGDQDAALLDAGNDSGQDAATDAGTDAGTDSGEDAGQDAGDAGPIDLCEGVTCAAVACKKPGLCNPFSGSCEYANADDLTACATDGVPCTVDQCVSGACTHTMRDCSNLNAACVDGVCNSVTGVCEGVAKTNNTICTDNNMCTQGDTCQGGMCIPGPQPNCTQLDTTCTVGSCNPSNGQCRSTNRSNSTVCSDTFTDDDGTFANYCTTNDHCMAGVCVSGPLACETNCGGSACVYNWCKYDTDANACSLTWEHDGACDCGCQFEDGLDCGTDTGTCDFFGTVSGGACDLDWYGDGDCDCTCDFNGSADLIDCGVSPDCDNDRTIQYPNGNCPGSMDGNGQCDCGCKFGPMNAGRADSDCPT